VPASHLGSSPKRLESSKTVIGCHAVCPACLPSVAALPAQRDSQLPSMFPPAGELLTRQSFHRKERNFFDEEVTRIACQLPEWHGEEIEPFGELGPEGRGGVGPGWSGITRRIAHTRRAGQAGPGTPIRMLVAEWANLGDFISMLDALESH
jgi:hypothetical protein